MKIAVVGNGPSAAKFGEQIDACDFVVRVNFWLEMFPGNAAGGRCDAWAWYGQKEMRPECVPPGDCEFWLCARPINEVRLPSYSRALRTAGRRYTRITPIGLWNWLHDRLGTLPSTGIQAVHMALDLKPSALLLVGFDYAGSWKKGPHSPDGEKRLLQEIVDRGNPPVEWLGRADQ
jgi:hypothetical protein